MAFWKGKGRRFPGRKRTRSRLEVLTERMRQEGQGLSRKQRIEARRALRTEIPQQSAWDRLSVLGYETRRRLRPVFAPVVAVGAWVAPYITRSLLFVIQLIAGLIALVLGLAQLIISRLGTLVGVVAVAVAGWTRRHVTPRATVAVVGAGAAILLGAAQFADYHGVAVDTPDYEGIGSVVSPPITGQETAGSAHVWILLPVAAAALLFVWGAYRGSRRFAAGMVICGIFGLAVALAVDLPQGLETGRAGLAFTGVEAQLLGGFWVEVFSSATLILCGCLLPLYSRGMSPRRRRPNRTEERSLRTRASHQEVGGIPPGLRAES